MFAVQQIKINSKCVLSLLSDQVAESSCEVLGMKPAADLQGSSAIPVDSWIRDQTITTKLSFKGKMIQPLNPNLVKVDGKQPMY